jgi:hypothetical protein
VTGADVLRAAAANVTPETWCQHDTFQDEYGQRLPLKYGAARCCALGHLAIAAGDDRWAAMDAADIFRDYVEREVSDWNDEPKRTAAEVRAAMLAAASVPVREAVLA